MPATLIPLDFRTALVGFVASSAVGVALMVLLWRQGRKRSPEIGLWLVGFLLQFCGLLLLLLRGQIPDWLSIVFGNELLAVGIVILYVGLQHYVGRKGRQLHNYAMLVVYGVLLSYFAFVEPSLLLRTIVVSAGGLFICTQGVWSMFRQPKPELRPASMAVGFVFLAFGVLSLARICVNLTTPAVDDMLKSGSFDVLAILLYQMLQTALMFCLFLLVGRGLLATLENDVARRQQTEVALRSSEQKFSAAFQNVPDAILIARTLDGRIIEANESCFRIIGFAKDEMCESTTIELGLWVDEADRERFLEELRQHGGAASYETMFRKKSGALFPGTISGEILTIQDMECILEVIHDDTNRKMNEARLRELSDTDPLTGILNHRAFYGVAAEKIMKAAGPHIALIYMDLDHLKAINDEFGHIAGDEALVLFAQALREGFRESDVIGRMGGDEFAVLVISREDASDEALTARFLAKLAEKNADARQPFEISMSFGVARWDCAVGTSSLEDLIRVADSRMYAAKRAR